MGERMRLGHKFVLLIVGSLAMPVLAVLVLVALNIGSFSESVPPWSVFRLAHAVSTLERSGAAPERVVELLREASPAAEAMVFDAGGRLVASTTPGGSVQELLTAGEAGSRRVLQQSRITAPDGKVYTVLAVSPGQRITVAVHSLPGLVVPGSFFGFMTLMSLIIIRSINTSIRRLEEATRRISEGDLDFKLEARGNDRIASLSRSFDAMRERLRDEGAARSRFIMAVSHDLKTPLSSISGYLDAIAEGMASTPEALAKYLAIIRDKAGLLESRIAQLIDFVKLETSEWSGTREDALLAPFLDEAATVFGVEAEARGFAFERVLAIGPGTRVSMDGALVSRALENLVDNAFRYAEAGSAVRLEAAEADGVVVLGIANRGTPIAERDLPFIFEPFYRGAGTRRETGFGLGLAVVKSVVSSHGWDMAVRSADGETRFTITIPLAPAPG
jgi:signal transduction histidine kinase